MNNKEKEAQEEFEKLSYRLHKSTKKVSFITSLQNAFINVNYYINVTIICLYSVIVTFLSSSNENSPIFSIPSFLILIQLAQIPYTNFSTSIIGLTSTLTSLERCNVFLKNEEVLEENEKEIQKIESIEKIEFKNVSFGYTEQNNNIINNFNLKISKNQKIGIIGETGSGKTTILNLLMRFYECGDGKILINGMDIKNIKISQVRSLFSIINQEP
jgi:ATP-binding cassette subfamily B protein